MFGQSLLSGAFGSASTPVDNFNTVIYTGDSPGTQSVNTVGFQPDMVWVKGRDESYNHVLFDSIRGVCERLNPNNTNQQSDWTPNGVSAFNATGFDVTAPGSQGYGVNENGIDYVGWCWKAGGAPTATNSAGQTPTAGSKMVDGVADSSAFATVSNGYPTKQTINTTLDFSITEYTKTGGTSQIPHGLSGAPEFVILKFPAPGYLDQWQIYHSSVGTGKYLQFNSADGATTRANSFSAVNSTYVESDWTSGLLPQIMYSFKSVAGFSKIGSYTATQSAGSPTETIGFEPKWIMIKNMDRNQEWVIIDSVRGNNPGETLVTNTLDAEYTGNSIIFTSTGFTINDGGGGINYATGDTLVYIAFAA